VAWPLDHAAEVGRSGFGVLSLSRVGEKAAPKIRLMRHRQSAVPSYFGDRANRLSVGRTLCAEWRLRLDPLAAIRNPLARFTGRT
jgi:hypothetical protein